jgi:hypothetical protein
MPGARQWEYKTMSAAEPTANKAQLDEFGMDGWLLVQVYQWAGSWIYIFVREI